MSDAVLVCRELRKRYGDLVAVDGVSFAVGPGECYGLLGPNGAGKTTSISMACGLLRRDGGEVFVAGHPMDGDASQAKRAIGYVPQEIALYPDLSGVENLRFFGRLYGLGGKELAARVDEVLGVVGLADRAQDRVEKYSGGMQRRLNIAAALLHHPRLLVLDEPTVGVDPQSRNAILESVEDLRRDGTAVLYTTHYMEEAERVCDRVGIIDTGCILAEGTHRELVAEVGQRDQVSVTGDGDLEALARALRDIEGVEDTAASPDAVDVIVSDARRLMPRLLEGAERVGVKVSGVQVTEPNLEAVFLHLTGKTLRD